MSLSIKDDKFYEKVKLYWSEVPPTLNGILGGYECIHDSDITESKFFLKRIFKLKTPPGTNRALDCGAGIGRVTFNLLIKYFNVVDVVEQNSNFVVKIRTNPLYRKIGTSYSTDIQTFVGKNNLKLYDIIWCQWVLGNLTDQDMIRFFKSCKNILRRNGVIVVKENIVIGNEDVHDEISGEITRTFGSYCSLFNEAGYRPIFIARQQEFPDELYKVQLFALRSV